LASPIPTKIQAPVNRAPATIEQIEKLDRRCESRSAPHSSNSFPAPAVNDLASQVHWLAVPADAGERRVITLANSVQLETAELASRCLFLFNPIRAIGYVVVSRDV